MGLLDTRVRMGPRAFAAAFAAARGTDFDLLNPEDTAGPVVLECRHCGLAVMTTPAKALRTAIKNRANCQCTRQRTGPKEQTIADWQRKFDIYHGGREYTIVSERYLSNTADNHPYQFRHETCGTVFEARMSSLLAAEGHGGARCPCRRIKLRQTAEIHRADLSPDYELVEWRGSGEVLHLYRHRACGQTFERRRWHAVNTPNCPHCHGANRNLLSRITPAAVQAQLDAIHGAGEYAVLDVEHRVVTYGTSAPATIYGATLRHTCGHEFSANHNTFRGNTHLGRCPLCHGTSRQTREVWYGGKRFRVVGFEERALIDLLRTIKAKNIMSRDEPGFPVVYYRHKGPKKYYCDFFVSSTQTVVEVKSTATAGLIETGNRFFDGMWERLQAKARRCLKMGYRFKLMLYLDTPQGLQLARLPDNWIRLTKYQMAEAIGHRISRKRKAG